MKKLLCTVLSVLIVCLSVITFRAVQTDNPATFSDSSGVYTVRYNAKHADITCYGDHNLNISLNLNERIDAVYAAFGRAVFFCDDARNNQIVVSTYDIASDYLDSFAIYGYTLFADTAVCCDRDYIYIENQHNANELLVYTFDGSPVNSVTVSGTISGLTCGFNNGAYVTANGALYDVSGGRCDRIAGAGVKSPLFPADGSVLLSGYGEAYVLNGRRIERVIPLDGNTRARGVCVIGGTLYYPSGSGVINGYDLNSGERAYTYSCDTDVTAVYADRNRIGGIDGNGNNILNISPADFRDLRAKQDSGNSGSQNGSSGSHASVGTISSDAYTVNYRSYMISDIPTGTTVAAFRSHMRYEGYSLTVYRGNAERSSGNVGTGMTAVFRRDNDSIRYELSVRGDLTGEGNMNSRDLNILMDYLIGAADFNGVYLLSADLSKNGNVDIADVAMMKHSI